MKSKSLLFLLVFVASALTTSGTGRKQMPQFSHAGYYELRVSGRTVANMDIGWKFHRGALDESTAKPDFNDSGWQKVNLPDGMEYLPADASGGVNYQGEVWYRKHSLLDESFLGKKMSLHFEAIMGKSRI